MIESQIIDESTVSSETFINTSQCFSADDKEAFTFPLSFQITAHIMYNIVLVLGLIGNGCVLLIFTIRQPLFGKLPTPLLANLAVGDLLITVFCLEASYLNILWQYWPYGEFLCFALSPVNPIAVFVSSYTLIVLSVDRYLTVLDPLNKKLSRRHIKWSIVVVWALAVCTSIPTGIFTSYEIHNLTGLPRCSEKWESEVNEIIYDVVIILFQIIIPVLVFIYTYTRISIVVLKNRLLRLKMSHGTSPRKNNFRTIRMSLMVVLGYSFAWIPFNAATLIVRYNYNCWGDSDFFPYVFVACHWLAMSHTVYNPVIYFWMNESFRLTVMELFCRNKALAIQRRRISSYRSTGGGNSSIRRQSPGINIKPIQFPDPNSKSVSLQNVENLLKNEEIDDGQEQ